MQAVLSVETLPECAIDAAAQFMTAHLASARSLLDGEADALAIVLPSAPRDHDDWRRAVARDLARAHAPTRVNVIGTSQESQRIALLGYLEGAPGITGQYLPGHE